ncbi:uncharacterized protein LOC141851807 [Brevipalpus obovatus]|uniref:uncharacterized protein LOC141851807 n=1 Tax=Brevipalpus obovatus TaxID=246614 RepID=UPI003D9F37D9
MTTPLVKTPFRSNNRNRSASGKENSNLNREVKNLRRQLEDERIRVEDMELDCKSKDEQVNKLKEEVDMCKARIRSLNDVLASMIEGDEYEKCKSELEGLKRSHEMVTNELKFYQKCVKDLEEEIKSVYKSNTDLNNKFESLLKDMEKLAKENLDLSHLRAKYEDLSDKSKMIIEENDELRSTIEFYKEQARREQSNESIMCSPLSADVVVTGCGEPVSLFTELMQQDKDELEKSRKLVDSLKQEIEELKTKAMDTERLREENVAIAAQKNLLMQQVNELFCKQETFHSTREAEKQRSNEHIKHLKDTLIQRDEEIAKMKSERKGEKREVKSLKAKVKELENEVKILDASFNFERRTKERLMRENDHLEAMMKDEQYRMSTAAQSKAQISHHNSQVHKPPRVLAHKIGEESQPFKLHDSQPEDRKAQAKKEINHQTAKALNVTHVSKPIETDIDAIPDSKRDVKNKVVPAGTSCILPMAEEDGEIMEQGRSILSDSNSSGKVIDPEEDPFERFGILQNRNARVLPHLKSSYPVEFQEVAVPESSLKQKGPIPTEIDPNSSTLKTSFRHQPPRTKTPYTGFIEFPPPERATKRMASSSNSSTTSSKSSNLDCTKTLPPRPVPRTSKAVPKSATFTIPFH